LNQIGTGKLMVNLLFIEDDADLAKPGGARSLYDPTRGVVDYIVRFYNQNRTHSKLDYLSPNQFEAKLKSAPDKMLA